LSKIYVLGNPLVEEDSLPLRLLPKLRKRFQQVDFVELDPTETLPEGDLVIIDTVINADKIVILRGIDSLSSQPNYSLHDLDLAMNLKLMKKLGKINNVTIIGLPPNLEEKRALKELEKAIPSALSGNG